MKRFTIRFAFLLSITIGSCQGSSNSLDTQSLNEVDGSLDGVSSPEECARDCKDGEPPKTCYYRFKVEYYSTLTKACNYCRQNSTSRVTADCQCIEADGYEKSGLITVNRMYPGPGIMVCLNDNVVVDVENNVPGNAITIHWHGIYQANYQYADGVPFVSQCPIQEGSTFRYQFKAGNSGSHLWHAHTGLHKGEGLMGPLIIREPKNTEPNSNLWDFDNIDNVIFLSDWFHRSSADHFPGNVHRESGQEPDNFLINGMGELTDPISGQTNANYADFAVKAGQHYRFRLINGCGLTCPVELTIEGHNLTVIASDGQPLEPFTVDTITSFAAERYDFILDTDKTPGNYWIQIRALGPCAARKQQQFAILHYDTAPVIPVRSTLTYDAGLETGVILNQLNIHCFGEEKSNLRCLSQQNNAKAPPLEIFKDEPDVRLFLNFGFYTYDPESLFQPGRYPRYHVVGGGEFASMMGNISNILPASPMLSQRSDIPDSQVCSVQDYTSKCNGAVPCECVHIERIPLNSVVEIILVDEAQVPGLSHPFHLHGHSFYLFGEGNADLHNQSSINLDSVKDLHRNNLLNRRLLTTPEGNEVDSPQVPAMLPAKDTFAVPNNGYSIVRFLANNPGYWPLHCHFEFHAVTGMMTIFHVGEPKDLPPVPEGFPRCGQYKPALVF